MRRTSGRLIAVVAAVATATLALAGCSSSSSSESGTSVGSTTSGTIEVWVRDYEKSLVKPLVKAFNKTHTLQVKMTLIPAAQYVQKLGTAAASDSAPDVAATDLVFSPYFASAGAFMDITSDVDALSYKDDLSSAHMAQATYDGKIYAVPFTGDVSVLFYNKTLFEEAGLDPDDPPTTYAEMEEDAAAITALGGKNKGFVFSGACGGCNIFELGPHVWASGGSLLSDDGLTSTLDSSEVTDMLQLYQDMWENGDMPSLAQTDNGPNAGTAFEGGTVGMKADGTAFLGTLVDQDKVDFGVTAIPGKDGGTSSFTGGDNMSIMSGASNPAGAWEFLKWITGEEAQTILANNATLPIRLDLLDDIYTPQDPRYEVFAEALSEGKVPYSVSENEIFNDNNGIWSKMIQTAVFDGDISGAQATAQAAAQAVLDKNS